MPSLGHTRIPPLPNFIVLTDREDGTEWVLSHIAGRVSINTEGLVKTPITSYNEYTKYEAFAGPAILTVVGVYKINLLVRAGRLGYEIVSLGENREEGFSARVLTRRGVQRLHREIHFPTTTDLSFPFPSLLNRGLAHEQVVP